jgi:hypothetical protein
LLLLFLPLPFFLSLLRFSVLWPNKQCGDGRRAERTGKGGPPVGDGRQRPEQIVESRLIHDRSPANAES